MSASKYSLKETTMMVRGEWHYKDLVRGSFLLYSLRSKQKDIANLQERERV